jgi:hypothetical protein
LDRLEMMRADITRSQGLHFTVESTLLVFMLREGVPDMYAFDLQSQGPEYAVVVWAVDATVHEWGGFSEVLLWVRQSCQR